MKKLFIVLVIAAAFTACNSESTESTTETSAPATTEVVAPAPVETAPASTDAPTTTATSSH